MSDLAVVTYDLVWPDLSAARDGSKPFLAWGPLWGYHFDDEGIWRKGKLCRQCVMSVPNEMPACPRCGRRGEGQHGGLDKILPMRTPLVFPEPFTCIKAGDSSGAFGTRVLLHLSRPARRSDWSTFFPYLTIAHMDSVNVVDGFRYPANTLIGYSGASGNTGKPPVPHAHLQLEEFMPFPRRVMQLNLKAAA